MSGFADEISVSNDRVVARDCSVNEVLQRRIGLALTKAMGGDRQANEQMLVERRDRLPLSCISSRPWISLQIDSEGRRWEELSMVRTIHEYFEHVSNNFRALQAMSPVIDRAAAVLVDAIRRDKKVMFCGNGGSAADSQHLAAEFMGRFLKDRRALPALALTVDTSALTAIGNDYGFADVFARQLHGIGRSGDVLVGLSSSGNSENVIRAARIGREIDVLTIALTGENGGGLAQIADIAIRVPSNETNHIQEMHIAVGHYLCSVVEAAVC